MNHEKMYLIIMMMIQIQFLITFKIPSSGTFMIVPPPPPPKNYANYNAWVTTGIKSLVIIKGNCT